MMFVNPIKILFRNFSGMWKLLLYYIIVIAIASAIALPFILGIWETLSSSGITAEVGDVLARLNGAADIFSICGELGNIFTGVINVIGELFVSHTVYMIFLTFIICWLLPYFLSLSELPVQEMTYGYMSSCTRYGFTSSFIKNFGKSATIQLVRSTSKSLLNVIIAVAVYYILALSSVGGVMYYILPFLMFAILIVLVSAKEMLCMLWIPAIVVYDCNVFSGFQKGIVAVKRKFWKNFSSVIMVMLLIVMINYFFGTFAFLVTIPLCVFFYQIFSHVVFFTSQGMRYYIELETIVSPLKLEEKDSFSKLYEII